MKTCALAFLVACAPVCAQTNYGTITFTNKSGYVMSNAVVTKVEGNKLTYHLSGGGGGVVKLADLPEALQARFGYSPTPADNAAAVQRPAPQTKADRKQFEETKTKAEKGDAQAQHFLGLCYALGSGVTQDAAEAAKWYRKAAEQGNAKGQYWLGLSYATGEGVAKDAAEAVKWYRKAAEQGDAKAQFLLGLCYTTGDGLAKDAADFLATFSWWAAPPVTDCGVTKDAAVAVKWIRKAAEQGNADAQFLLGLCYAAFDGVTNYAVDTSYSRWAAAHVTGSGVVKDDAEAVKWYRKAAEQGNGKAQFQLGRCYYSGVGVAEDKAEGLKWISQSLAQLVKDRALDGNRVATRMSVPELAEADMRAKAATFASDAVAFFNTETKTETRSNNFVLHLRNLTGDFTNRIRVYRENLSKINEGLAKTNLGPVILTTSFGTIISNAFFYKALADEAMYRMSDGGGGVIRTDLLPKEIQEQLGYDPEIAIGMEFSKFPEERKKAAAAQAAAQAMQEDPAAMQAVKFKDGVPISVYNDIAAEAARDWPKSYNMQDWQIKREIEAYKKLHQ